MKEKTFSDPLEPLSEDANRAMLCCCEQLAMEAKIDMDAIVRRAEENIRLWNDNNKYARLIRKAYEYKFGKPKEIDMKEKKTKKMTKAEAFEWLNNKKLTAKDDVYVNVLFKLFECGIEWAVGGQSFTYYGSDFLIIEGGKLFHCGHEGDSYWRLHHFKEISVDDILSIEIVDEKYELEFNYDKVVELAKPLMHYLNEVACRDSIRVSQLGIVHEPMSTLIFDNGIGE